MKARLVGLLAFFVCVCSVLGGSTLQPEKAPSEKISAEPYPETAAWGNDFLRIMELRRGNDDIAVEESNIPRILSTGGQRMPTSLFGIFKFPTPPKGVEVRKPNTQDDLQNALIRAYEEDRDVNNWDKTKFAQWKLFLRNNPTFKQNVQKLFSQLNVFGTHELSLSKRELQYAMEQGKLTETAARCVLTWDVNYDKKISWAEFKLGPFFLVALQSKPKLLAQFRANMPGNAASVTKYFRSLLPVGDRDNDNIVLLQESSSAQRLRRYLMADKLSQDPTTAKLLGLQPVNTGQPRFTTLGAGVKTRAQEEDTEMAFEQVKTRTKAQAAIEAQADEEVRAEAADRADLALEAEAEALDAMGMSEARAKELGIFDMIKRGISGAISAVKGALGKKGKAKGGKKGKPKDPRPKSKFGIPSYADEKCVLCQYIMQRVEKELKARVVDDYSAFTDFKKAVAPTGGLSNLQQMTGRNLGARGGLNAGLVSTRGERSPIRMMTEVLRTVMRNPYVCGPRAPFLFRQPCEEIFRLSHTLGEGLYRRMQAGANCQVANICTPKTYFKKAVHLPEESMKINGKRGMCGLLGGPNARKVKGASPGKCKMKGKKKKGKGSLLGRLLRRI